jgi:hypothetical protein
MAIFPSVTCREQLVEQIAEPGFKHLDFSLSHPERPRVNHPSRQVVGSSGAGRPGRRRWRTRAVVKIVRQYVTGCEILSM